MGKIQTSLSTEKALQLYELLCLSRYTDEKMGKLVKQNKGGTFQLSAAGHELIGVVFGQQLRKGKDWSLPYYRDQPFAISLGCALDELFAGFMGRATKNHSSGRMMPYHFSHKELRMLCQSSVVGSQFLQAAGRGLGVKNLGKEEVVYVSGGEGSTSQGDFHEAMNFSALHKLPVVFVIQNNGYAISVPASEQTAGGSVINVARGYAGMEVFEVDGTDYLALNEMAEKAFARARRGEGPSFVMAHVPRLLAHSSSDDAKKYKPDAIEEDEVAKDPVVLFKKWISEEHLASTEEIAAVEEKAKKEVEEAARLGELFPNPEQGSSRHHVFAPFHPPISLVSKTPSDGEKIVMMDALNHALEEEMIHDSHVIVFGQDVAHGKGGVFGITRKLTEKFGVERCFNTPLAESTIVGIAIGLSADGIHKPVAEIQFADYMWTGINQIVNEAASIHYRSNGEFDVPIVIRMPYGGYIQGGPYHSQSVEAYLAHTPGLKVVVPSNAADAKGLLKTAIRDPNPVIFLEHKALYRQQKFCARVETSKETFIPFGQASIVREGTDLTLVAWGMTVVMGWEVAEKLAQEGISVEVIDLRTLVPLDMNTIIESVRKTGKLLIAHEASRSCGFGAEVAARIAEEAFEVLDAPIMRLGGFESAVPYSKPMENEVLPQLADVELAIRKLVRM